MILRVAIRLAIVIVLMAALVAIRLHDDPEHARPPHVERPTAAVAIGTPLEEAGAIQTAIFLNYVDGIAVGEYLNALEAERLAAEAAAAEAARLEAARRASTPTPSSGGAFSQPTSCGGHIIPGYILQRESGCNYGAVNPSGCGGASCVGLYQFDLRHFTSGACAGLDWHSPADQDECARRISNNGTNLAPWGG